LASFLLAYLVNIILKIIPIFYKIEL